MSDSTLPDGRLRELIEQMLSEWEYLDQTQARQKFRPMLNALLASPLHAPSKPREWECICTHHYRAHDRFTGRCTDGGCECSGYVDGPAAASLRPIPASPLHAGAEPKLMARVENYLVNGGLVNPEAMESDKVRTLIIDLAAALSSSRTAPQDEEPKPEASDALSELTRIVCEIYREWDNDNDPRVGKLLAALGGSRGYRADIDAFRATLWASRTAPEGPKPETTI